MSEVNLDRARKGRGATSNPEGRFETVRAIPFDDGWGTLEEDLASSLHTTVAEDVNRTIITENQSPDIPFERSINPYRGCEHGCIYCYARQSHAYLGLSPGLDFETKLFAKSNAPALLEEALRKKNYVCKPITLGSNTDPYQPIERERRLTRRLLEILYEYRHPAAIITKSGLIKRDLDILSEMAQMNLIRVFVSVTTLNPELARTLEPRAGAPHRRIQTVRFLAEAGVPTSVNAAPMIPALNDMELETIMTAAAEAGAVSASYILIRLPGEVRDLFVNWLEAHYPDKAKHVMSLIRQTRDGKDYQSQFGHRMKGTGTYAELMNKRFVLARRRLKLEGQPPLATRHFRRPIRPGDQLPLFG